MQLTLYENMSPNFYANKTLNNATVRNCELIYPLNVLNPALKLLYDGNFTFNYAKLNVDGIDRYYFIDNKEIENKTITLILNQDDIVTWKNDILTAKGLISRSRVGNKYIPDTMATQTKNTNWQFRDIGTCFTRNNSYNYVVLKGGIL